MGPLGWQETVFIFLLALLIFGPKKLPELGKSVGKAITEFRRASSELKATWNREMSSLEREGHEIKEATSSYTQPYSYQDESYNYESSYYDGTTGEPETPSDSTAQEIVTVGATAPEGAESESGTAPEGTVATTVEDADVRVRDRLGNPLADETHPEKKPADSTDSAEL